MKTKGCTHIYTGNGKGKTTAALGLALRAAGAGMNTIIIQFMKGRHYSELDGAAMLGGLVRIEQYGSRKFLLPGAKDFPAHLKLAHAGLERARRFLAGGEYRIVVLDEIITAMQCKLLAAGDILRLIEIKPRETELVLTGRGATKKLIVKADLVTEMKEVKHYYATGVKARTGIEE